MANDVDKSNVLGGISSTEVRRRLQNGDGIHGLVTHSVNKYIKEKKMYEGERWGPKD